MTDIVIALNQVNFPDVPVRRFLDYAIAADAQAVELHPALSGEPLTEVVRTVGRAGLPVVSVSPLPDWYAESEGGHRLPSALPDLTRVASDLGALVGVPSPLWDPVHDGRPSTPDVINAIRNVVEYTREHSADAAFEPVGRSVMRPGAVGVLGRLGQTREVLSAHDLSVPLVADSYCLATAGDDLCEAWSCHDVPLIQLADWDGADSGRLDPGAGILPLARWLRHALADGGPRAVSLEVFPIDRPASAALAAETVNTVRRLVAAALCWTPAAS